MHSALYLSEVTEQMSQFCTFIVHANVSGINGHCNFRVICMLLE